MKKIYVSMYMTACLWLPAFGLRADLWKTTLDVSVEVEDEQGQKLEGSHVKVFFRHTEQQEEKTGVSTKIFEKIYDGEEPISIHYSGYREVGFSVDKEGYWPSELGYDFTVEDRIDERDGSPNGHYRKAFKIMLRKKERPRPMYLYKIDWAKVPGYDQPYGYDLEKADWVAPHGKGQHADFVFTIRGNRISEDEFRMEFDLSFSHPHDGLIEVKKSELSMSRLLLGQSAPITGYQPDHFDYYGVELQKGNLVSIHPGREQKLDQIEGYWFRIRSESETDKEEETKGRYGKIVGSIRFSGRPERQPSISFTYFLAPDHSASLEYNGENLMKKRGGNLNSMRKH